MVDLTSRPIDMTKSSEVESSVITTEILAEKPQVEGGGKTNLQEQAASGQGVKENEEKDTGSELSSEDEAAGDIKIQEFIKERNKF